MAMFGDFAELPFFEVVRMVRSRRGRLVVYAESGEVYKFFIQEGCLVQFLINDQVVNAEVSRHLSALGSARRGRFEFMVLPQPLVHTSLALPLEGLERGLQTQNSLQSEAERDRADLERLRDALPHSSTRFGLREFRTPGAQAALDSLLERFPALHPALRSGVDAEALARDTAQPLEQARLTLYRLHQAGALEVRRAFSQTQPSTQAAAAPSSRSSTPRPTDRD